MATPDPPLPTCSDSRSKLDEAFRDYAWNYFDLYAAQRLKTFQFYITLSAALIGGLIAIGSKPEIKEAESLKIGLGFSLFFISFIFYKLDLRTKQLIEISQDALKYLDDQYGLKSENGKAHVLQLFSVDDQKHKDLPLWPIHTGHFSYSRCFRWVFSAIGLGGLFIVYQNIG